MDVPKHWKTRMTSGVTFDMNSDSSSDEEDAADPMFNRYLFTPPSRQSAKGLIQKQRKLQRASTSTHKTSSSRSRSTTPDESEQSAGKERLRTPSGSKKWQQREISKQRESERTMKRVTSDITIPRISTASAMAGPSSSSDDDSNNAAPSAEPKNQQLKVINPSC